MLINLIGKRFGRLTVIERAESRVKGRPEWKCVCECGNEIVVLGENLRRGHTTSCGCYRMERIKEANTKHGGKRRVEPASPLYHVWNSMKARCYNEKHKSYQQYGARGIYVCPEWVDSFDAFRDWALAHGYRDGLTLDRKENDGPYSPDNCRWITNLAQQNNKRNNRLLTANGETHTLAEWARKINLSPETIASRIERGWTTEKAVTTSRRK